MIEYKVVTEVPHQLERALNELVADGWRVVSTAGIYGTQIAATLVRTG